MGDLDAVVSLPELLAELDRLRRRAARGTGKVRLSLSDIAKACGIPRSTLASYLNGSTLITADALDAVVLALGVTPREARRWTTAWERVTAVPRTTPGPVPRQVPAGVAGFVGRTPELAALGRPLTVISGPPGVGKSALAVHWAHQAAGRFPDGQLYIDLRGYGPGPPLEAGAALDSLLRSLGGSVPAGLEAASSAYRSLLSGRRMLVILDNARSADQVRPLLPATAGNSTIVTSRDALPGLVARDGARRLVLAALTDAEAHELLSDLLGTGRINGQTAEDLNRCCAGLPLALRIAGERIGSHPARTAAGLVAEIARTGLDALAGGGDPLANVRTVFSWSYAALSAPAARMFRLLGVVPGPTVAEPAAARLADTGVDEARQVLAVLVRAHLVTAPAPDRYGQHDLLKLYASELAGADPVAGPAHCRLLEHYLETATAAMDVVAPHERHLRPAAPPPAGTFRDAAAGLSWLEAERTNLLAAVDTAPDRYVHRLSTTLWRYLDTISHYSLGRSLHARARAAARADGEPAAEALATGALSLAEYRLGDHAQAMHHARQAVQVDDPGLRGLLLIHLGVLHLSAHQPKRALAVCRQALSLLERAGDRASAAMATSNIATAYERLGNDELALEHHRRSRDRFRELDNRAGLGHSLASLAGVHARHGDDTTALDCHAQALALFQAAGYADGRAAVLEEMGRLHTRRGDREQARVLFGQAQAARRAIDQVNGEPASGTRSVPPVTSYP